MSVFSHYTKNFRGIYTAALQEMLAESADGTIREMVWKDGKYTDLTGKAALRLYTYRQHSLHPVTPWAIPALEDVWQQHCDSEVNSGSVES